MPNSESAFGKAADGAIAAVAAAAQSTLASITVDVRGMGSCRGVDRASLERAATMSSASVASKRYAVFGDPVLHSLSPRIHTAFGRQTSIALDYTAIEAAPDDFPPRSPASRAPAVPAPTSRCRTSRRRRGCATCSRARQTRRRGQTLVRNGEGWHGDNTDGAGWSVISPAATAWTCARVARC